MFSAILYRYRGRRDSCAQIIDGTIGTMTVETTSTFFDSSTQTGKFIHLTWKLFYFWWMLWAYFHRSSMYKSKQVFFCAIMISASMSVSRYNTQREKAQTDFWLLHKMLKAKTKLISKSFRKFASLLQHIIIYLLRKKEMYWKIYEKPKASFIFALDWLRCVFKIISIRFSSIYFLFIKQKFPQSNFYSLIIPKFTKEWH